MRTSAFIEYDSETDYSMTRPAYVSYYNDDDEFLQMNLYVDDMAVLIESVPDATHVRISFNQNNKDAIVFTDDTLEGAEAGQENVSEEVGGTEQNDELDESTDGAGDATSEAFDFDSVEDEAVLDTSEFTDQYLFMYQGINDEDAFTEMNDMATTRVIAYDSDSEYAINQSTDIVYYNESELLEMHSVEEVLILKMYRMQISSISHTTLII